MNDSDAARPDAPDGTSGPLVLFAEDLQPVRKTYARYLTLVGFRVAQVDDGRQALEMAIELSPAVILMDLSMPGLDGWQATRRIKTDPRTMRIPVIALTGYDAEESAKKAGCDGYLAKPCSAEDVVREIRRVLAESASDDRTPSAPA
jgi:two-component system, cell cycle response regulator DivK